MKINDVRYRISINNIQTEFDNINILTDDLNNLSWEDSIIFYDLRVSNEENEDFVAYVGGRIYNKNIIKFIDSDNNYEIQRVKIIEEMLQKLDGLTQNENTKDKQCFESNYYIGYIDTIYVDEKYRHKGVASFVLDNIYGIFKASYNVDIKALCAYPRYKKIKYSNIIETDENGEETLESYFGFENINNKEAQKGIKEFLNKSKFVHIQGYRNYIRKYNI